MTARTVHIIGLGCPKNLVDSECMAGILDSRGCRLTPAADEAEVIIVNTCAFILPAKEEAVDTILQAALQKSMGRCTHLVVTGCLPQRYGQSLAQALPEVDLFLGQEKFLVSESTWISSCQPRRSAAAPSSRNLLSSWMRARDACSRRLRTAHI